MSSKWLDARREADAWFERLIDKIVSLVETGDRLIELTLTPLDVCDLRGMMVQLIPPTRTSPVLVNSFTSET
jgi:hypothetical protein